MLGEGLSCFLLLLQNQLLSYVQMAIDSMAQQCCSPACTAPQSMGLFAKLDLIQVRAPCSQAGPQLPSWASAHDAFVLRPPSAPPSVVHGLRAQKVSGSPLVSQQTGMSTH